ncbi:MAG: protein phosphatase CheZ [Proteobacteria bacterium]|nr:protein phosphatase CheZ [Pseudomonadota bacterium]
MAEGTEDHVVQRKAFRIEAMLAPRRIGARPAYETDDGRGDTLAALHSEIAITREAMARNRQDLTTLIGDAKEKRLPRAAAQLGAAVDDMRTATTRILNLAEAADDSARALAASMKDDDYKRGLAQEIQDQIVKIYEACNFQDIAGQHIGKVISLLGTMEGQLDAIMARSAGTHHIKRSPAPAAKTDGLLNGPKLSGDPGHATQQDVDRIFS